MDRYIGLITDFGLNGSHYVASMKAVIAKVNPETKIIDISHSVKHFSIVEASYLINSTYKYFPEKTVFVAVIDPGVGSKREIIALRTDNDYYFVGPDNGLFPGALESQITECFIVKNNEYFHNPVSKTFHGRDIMAPVGAYISSGVPLDEIGPEIHPSELRKAPLTYNINEEKREVQCTIQYIDDFGNLTTNIQLENNRIANSNISVKLNQYLTIRTNNQGYKGPFLSYFASVPKENLLFIKGSTNYLEISINQGNAAEKLNITSGDIITIKF
ncbi:MAG: hypothetical protein EU541_02110 [Promethearchaeota archaeon]|nr:MAG: hypothetical protein EU541_02110 [Candidatus Lokiarchaeota archaeon]